MNETQPIINTASLATSLYKAYGDSADWKNFQGNKMPEWGELPDNIKKHWTEVANYVNELLEQRTVR